MSSILLKFAILFVFTTSQALTQILCPSDSIIGDKIDQENRHLSLKLEVFKTLQNLENRQYFIIQTLFPISLEDDQAISEYIKLIRANLRNRSAQPESLNLIVSCQDQLTPEQRTHLNHIHGLYRSVLTEQLNFLKLPESEKASYLHPQWERLISFLDDPELNQKLMQYGLDQVKILTNRDKNLKQSSSDVVAFLTLYYELIEEYYQFRNNFLLQKKQIQLRAEQNLTTLDEALKKLNDSPEWTPQLNVNLSLLINPLWRDFARRSLSSYQLEQQVPSMTPLDELIELKARITNLETIQEIENLIITLEQIQNDVLSHRHQIIEKNHRSNLELLLKASLVRSQYLKRSRDANKSRILDWDRGTIDDLIKELKIIPHRFSALVFHKIIEFKYNFTIKKNGWGALIKDTLALLLLLLIPLIAWFGINKISIGLDRFKEHIIFKSNKKTYNSKFAIWLGRLNPFIPWVIGILGLELIDRIAYQSSFDDITTLTPYLKFIFYYRIFRRLVVLLLTQMTSIGNLNLSRENRVKINSSSKNVAFFLLIISLILHTIESVVGQGLVYVLALNIIKIISLVLAFVVAHQWRFEASRLLQLELSPYWNISLNKFLNKKRSALISLPLIIFTILVMIGMMFLRWGSEFDLSKRFSAKLFRRKLESAERNLDHFDDALPEDYKKCFDNTNEVNQSLMYKYRLDILKAIKEEIDEWFEEKSDEHSLALYGEAGIGQSSLLKIIEKNYPNLKVINVTLTNKFTNKGQIQRYLGELLDVNLEHGLTELVQSDSKREPTLVLIDKCHQMFLAEVGGFEAYREFLDIINAQTQNIFWCATFNIYSWLYLNNVYGKNHYFRSIKKITAWSESEIKSMILERHELSGFKISYQEILNAARTSDDNVTVDFVETKFFRLLWEQSCGNPRTAIELWFSALKYVKPNKLKVGLPYSFRPKILDDLQDDASFIFYEILKHGDLTHAELKAVLNMGDGIIQYALKIGLENDLLIRSRGGRYSINSIMQPILINTLRKKNLIYGK
jgi:hypothetical protein